MNIPPTPTSQSRRFGLRVISRARALLAVSALAALALPTRSLAQTPTFNAFIQTNTGGQSFQHPGSFAVGDFNGDGKLDAIAVDGSGALRYLQGNGDGSFWTRSIDASNIGGTSSTVVGLPASFAPYLPNASDGYTRIKVADVNGDGKPDIICTRIAHLNFAPLGFASVMINQGNDANGLPQFSITHYYAPNFDMRSLTVGDLNADGKPDFVLGDAYGNVYFWMNNGNGTFTYNPNSISLANGGAIGPGVIADLDGDGKADYIVTSNQWNSTFMLYGNGDGTFQAPVSIRNYVTSVAVADVNGDGKPDLLVGAYGAPNQLMVYLNMGGRTFSAPTLFSTGGSNWNGYTSLAAADMNGDGKLDVVAANSGSNTAAVLIGDGTGSFGAPTTFAVGTQPLEMLVVDFNGDGKRDVATVNFNSNSVGVLLNTTVIVAPPVVASATASPVLGTAFSYQISATNSPAIYGATGLPTGLSFNTTTGLISGTATQAGNFTVALSATNAGGTGTGALSLTITAPVTVFASGISAVTTWDPIFPASAYPDPTALSTPTQTVGPLPNDPGWTNPHAAFVFPDYTHPWAPLRYSSPYNFDARWINAWSNITSRGPAGQSWTKYSTTVTGEGDFVLQFLADNVSWIYIDGALIGYQSWYWERVGTGRYTIHLSGAGPHELVFIIWDGGGAAGGKFRLETTQSFLANGGGTLPPPPPPSDTTAPVISGPGNIIAEATGPSGKAVTFTATATDNVDGSVPVTASPASGSTFAIGTTSVGLAASDAAHNTASASFTVTVRDTTPPGLLVPAAVVAEATSSSGAVVTYASATATDAVGVASVAYSQNSGTQFPLGVTTVNVTATDNYGNATTLPFTVTVQDTIAPAITVPASQTLEAASNAGAVATFSASASDAVGVTSLTYSAASGSTFAIGTTTVTVTAKDAKGNTSTAAFTITVKDTIAPVITVPASQTLEATSGAGAVATFSASASDAVGVTSLTYSAASGSTFAIGTTTVTVTAKDAAGNTSTATFAIKVQDTIAPALTVPANQILEATSAAGAVATYAASATDAVGVASLTYSAASGSTFALGTTTVTVTAKDAAGNTTTGSFTVTVRDTTAPVITSATSNAPTLWPPNHKMVAVTVSASASDLVGVASLKIISVTSSEPDNGLGDGDTANDIEITGPLTVNLRAERSGKGIGRTYTITVEAKDAALNASTKTVTVFVPLNQK